MSLTMKFTYASVLQFVLSKFVTYIYCTTHPEEIFLLLAVSRDGYIEKQVKIHKKTISTTLGKLGCAKKNLFSEMLQFYSMLRKNSLLNDVLFRGS